MNAAVKQYHSKRATLNCYYCTTNTSVSPGKYSVYAQPAKHKHSLNTKGTKYKRYKIQGKHSPGEYPVYVQPAAAHCTWYYKKSKLESSLCALFFQHDLMTLHTCTKAPP